MVGRELERIVRRDERGRLRYGPLKFVRNDVVVWESLYILSETASLEKEFRRVEVEGKRI